MDLINQFYIYYNASREESMLTFFVWEEKYTVQISWIDEQHKKLIRLINRLAEAMEDGQSGPILGDILRELTDYTRVHFTDEERLLMTHSYPALAAHLHEHQEFIRRLNDFYKGLSERQEFLSAKILDFLKQWLSSHILVEDKKYAAYLQSKGIRVPEQPA